jgi:antibiotic biosynthesis monooxygenase (ABM) superfamily enzyme
MRINLSLSYGRQRRTVVLAVVDRQLDNTSSPPRWLAPVITTLAAWLAAFLVVLTLLTLFRDELGSLPLALRALVISGLLVTLMVNVVMPVLSAAVARWLAGPLGIRRGRARLGTKRGESRA